ncbi:hypothetical protein RRG08_041966, partial [Elysia crispata]
DPVLITSTDFDWRQAEMAVLERCDVPHRNVTCANKQLRIKGKQRRSCRPQFGADNQNEWLVYKNRFENIIARGGWFVFDRFSPPWVGEAKESCWMDGYCRGQCREVVEGLINSEPCMAKEASLLVNWRPSDRGGEP